MRYLVNNKNELRIWDSQNPLPNNAPFALQANYPDGTEWTKEQATEWAEIAIENITNPNYEYKTGNSPDNPKILKPEVAEAREAAEQAEADKQAKLESAKAKLTALGLDEGEVQAILGL